MESGSLRYISLFSGFGGAELAWGGLGWTCAAVAEVDQAACAVLKHHWPTVPNLGDIEKITEARIKDLGPVDLVVFGSPCQDLSVAGKRAGLEGARSGLFFDAVRIVRWTGARFALWENVPGAFSSQEGRDFALVAGEMAGVRADVPDGGWRNAGFLAGPDALVEWAVLDAQYFGVPQRRRRIFALRDSGDWRSRPPILLEPQSLRGDPPPRREKRQVAPTVPARRTAGGGLGTDFDCDGGAIEICMSTGQGSAGIGIGIGTTLNCNHEAPILANPVLAGGHANNPLDETLLTAVAFKPSHFTRDKDGAPSEVTPPLSADADKGDQDTVIAAPVTARPYADRGAEEYGLIAFDARQDPCDYGQVAIAIQERAICENPDAGPDGVGIRTDDTAYTVEARQVPQAVAFSAGQSSGAGTLGLREEQSPTLRGASSGTNQVPAMMSGMQVRRLTPIETARLQGVPDDHCRIPYKGRLMADGPIYKMHGNGFCVPVVRWVGQRLASIAGEKPEANV